MKKDISKMTYKEESILKMGNKKNRRKAIAFVLPCVAVIALAYIWVIYTLRVELDMMGTSSSFQLIIIMIAILVFKKQIFDGALKRINKITKNLAKGKGLQEQFDEKIPLETGKEKKEEF